MRRHRLAVRAEEGAPQPSQQQLDDERRLEALEAAAKARKGLKAAESEALRGGSRPAAKVGHAGLRLFPPRCVSAAAPLRKEVEWLSAVRPPAPPARAAGGLLQRRPRLGGVEGGAAIPGG